MWLAVDGTWDTRLGLTLSVPTIGQQSLKFLYSTGAVTRRGSDFDTFNVTWQLVMFEGKT